MAVLAWNSLDLHCFGARWPSPLGELPSLVLPSRHDLGLPETNPGLPAAVRDLLRSGGFRPSGRNRPASEYLARAEMDGAFPQINVAVDAGNAVSLHGGLPVSVVDAGRLQGGLRVAVASPGTTYPFNPAGQVFDASGLVVLVDDDGVCATPVKDAQRTKTSPSTTETLCVVWGVAAHAAHGALVEAAYQGLLERLGCVIFSLQPCELPK
jgi:DNA/RNA-binding domain of Phe-tRNA-synthetase-like protein